MKYRIIQMVEGQLIKTEPLDVVAWAGVAGVVITGLNNNSRQREELQGQPKLEGFAGPLWDGDAIRYEDLASNEELSS